MARNTISYSTEMEEAIEALIETGVVANRSEFFQRAGQSYLGLLLTAVDTLENAEDAADAETALRQVGME